MGDAQRLRVAVALELLGDLALILEDDPDLLDLVLAVSDTLRGESGD